MKIKNDGSSEFEYQVVLFSKEESWWARLRSSDDPLSSEWSVWTTNALPETDQIAFKKVKTKASVSLGPLCKVIDDTICYLSRKKTSVSLRGYDVGSGVDEELVGNIVTDATVSWIFTYRLSAETVGFYTSEGLEAISPGAETSTLVLSWQDLFGMCEAAYESGVSRDAKPLYFSLHGSEEGNVLSIAMLESNSKAIVSYDLQSGKAYVNRGIYVSASWRHIPNNRILFSYSVKDETDDSKYNKIWKVGRIGAGGEGTEFHKESGTVAWALSEEAQLVIVRRERGRFKLKRLDLKAEAPGEDWETWEFVDPTYEGMRDEVGAPGAGGK